MMYHAASEKNEIGFSRQYMWTDTLIRGWFAAAFASTFSFPPMPQWLGTHMKETVSVLELKVVRRVKIRVTMG